MTSFTERINDLALKLATRDDPIAYELAELANELGEIEGIAAGFDNPEFPTARQGLALARFMRTVMRDDRIAAEPFNASARVSRGGAGLSNDYLYVQLGDGFVGGIDREGRVST